MGFFDGLSGLYGGAKNLLKQAGVTELNVGDVQFKINPENIEVPESEGAGTSPIQIKATPKIPTGIFFAGVAFLGVIIVLAIKARGK